MLLSLVTEKRLNTTVIKTKEIEVGTVKSTKLHAQGQGIMENVFT